MKRIIIALIILLGLSLFEPIQAQTAKVYGRIFMPAVKKKQRTFRGRLYRNRLSAKKKKSKKSSFQRSIFEDVVIAAYPLSFKAEVKPLKRARMLQKNAEFRPNVLAVTPGTNVQFINLDRFFHNVFSFTPGAKFNIGRRRTNTVVTRKINKTGSVKLFCDIHSQMKATIISLETPYFTQANKNGVYLLDKLPAGKYRLEVMHPNFPTIEYIIEVKRDSKVEKSFSLNR